MAGRGGRRRQRLMVPLQAAQDGRRSGSKSPQDMRADWPAWLRGGLQWRSDLIVRPSVRPTDPTGPSGRKV